jgi:hypothetical protein
VVRNSLAAEALRREYESILFIDADIQFDPWDALRLFARPEPVVAGVYLKKGKPEPTSTFLPEIEQVLLGPAALGLYPLEYAAAGFLRIHAKALRLMIEKLDLPQCNADWGGAFWPFFRPMIIGKEDSTSSPHYLSEDFAFSYRLRQIGVSPWPTPRSGSSTMDLRGIPGKMPGRFLFVSRMTSVDSRRTERRSRKACLSVRTH